MCGMVPLVCHRIPKRCACVRNWRGHVRFPIVCLVLPSLFLDKAIWNHLGNQLLVHRELFFLIRCHQASLPRMWMERCPQIRQTVLWTAAFRCYPLRSHRPLIQQLFRRRAATSNPFHRVPEKPLMQSSWVRQSWHWAGRWLFAVRAFLSTVESLINIRMISKNVKATYML